MGLHIERRFTVKGENVYDNVAWEKRTASVKDADGTVIFEQESVEVPDFWSQRATNVVAEKYFYGPKGSPQRESSVRQLIGRVVDTITEEGRHRGYFTHRDDVMAFRAELTHLCLHQYGAFNSPVWFNVGVTVERSEGWCYQHPRGDTPDSIRRPHKGEHRPQGSACFIQSVSDNMESIMALAASEAMLFKRGSGTGTDLSTLRSKRESLSGGGRPSGPISFLRVYDSVASVVKSGGKTRRAAKMNTLNVDHPDIMEFIDAKAKEEKKARALIAGGYSADFNGEAYASVAFQNANLSVRATDDFMRWATTTWEDGTDDTWTTAPVTGGPPIDTGLTASQILGRIASATWECGDPGMQFASTINRWHTCPNTAPINSSNPCSEFVFLDDSACNLASINLMKFRDEAGNFDVEGFKHAVKVFLVAQEILVDLASYPTEKIARNSHDFRPLGLGYANLGALLMASGIPYDSDRGRDLCGAVTAIMHAQALVVSAEMAKAMGPFPGFEANRLPMLDVIANHAAAAEDAAWNADGKFPTEALWNEAKCLFIEALDDGREHGYRNAQVTLLAPTGTIAFMMDCDTTGIEPAIALVAYKHLAGGGMMMIVNKTVRQALLTLGYSDEESDADPDGPSLVQRVINCISNGSGYWHELVEPEHAAVFDCALPDHATDRSLSWQAHLKMMAAAQPFLSGAISKTVNMPKSATVDEIRDAYVTAWKLGLKAVAIYRDGCKESQPLTTKKAEPKDDHPAHHFYNELVKDGVDLLDDPFRAEVSRQNSDESLRFYHADGSFTICESPEEVVRLRVEAAKRLQALESDVELWKNAAEHAEAQARVPRRVKPTWNDGRRVKFTVNGLDGYLHVGLCPEGRPRELFVTLEGAGETVAGMTNVVAKLASIALQYGAPLDKVRALMEADTFGPNGTTQDPDVPFCKSIASYLGAKLGKMYPHDGMAFEPRPTPPYDGDVIDDPEFLEALDALGDKPTPALVKAAEEYKRALNTPLVAPNPAFVKAADIEAETPIRVSSGRSCYNCQCPIPGGGCVLCPNCGSSNGACGG